MPLKLTLTADQIARLNQELEPAFREKIEIEEIDKEAFTHDELTLLIILLNEPTSSLNIVELLWNFRNYIANVEKAEEKLQKGPSEARYWKSRKSLLSKKLIQTLDDENSDTLPIITLTNEMPKTSSMIHIPTTIVVNGEPPAVEFLGEEQIIDLTQEPLQQSTPQAESLKRATYETSDQITKKQKASSYSQNPLINVNVFQTSFNFFPSPFIALMPSMNNDEKSDLQVISAPGQNLHKVIQ